jgi:O-antigen/teichoic acid export membrane protein
MQPVLILHAVTGTFGLVLFSQRRERRTLRIVTIVVAFNIASGILLIYAYGVTGAAISYVLTYLLSACLHYAAARDCLTNSIGSRLPWRDTLIGSVVAAGCIMAATLALSEHLNFIVATVLTSFLYVVVLAVLVYAACRGSLGLRERFFVPLGEQ